MEKQIHERALFFDRILECVLCNEKLGELFVVLRVRERTFNERFGKEQTCPPKLRVNGN